MERRSDGISGGAARALMLLYFTNPAILLCTSFCNLALSSPLDSIPFLCSSVVHMKIECVEEGGSVLISFNFGLMNLDRKTTHFNGISFPIFAVHLRISMADTTGWE